MLHQVTKRPSDQANCGTRVHDATLLCNPLTCKVPLQVLLADHLHEPENITGCVDVVNLGTIARVAGDAPP
jgi:hypothetical protein